MKRPESYRVQHGCWNCRHVFKADFIASARTEDVPDLLAEVERLRDIVERYGGHA